MSIASSFQNTKEMPPIIGRKTNCDRCGDVKPGCIWVRKTDEDGELADWCLCTACRDVWRRAEIPFENKDVDFPEVI